MPAFVVVACILGVVLLFVWMKLVQARRVEFIREFSLPRGLYDKLREKHPDLSLKDCQLVGHALRQFFLAYLKSGKQYVSMPSQVVDDLWHEFILYTRNYAQFCRRAFGGFLHHTPAAALGGKRQSNDGLRRCWWQVCREENIDPQKPTRLPLLLMGEDGKRFLELASQAASASAICTQLRPERFAAYTASSARAIRFRPQTPSVSLAATPILHVRRMGGP